MFTPDFVIDSIQSSKKNFVNYVVQQEPLKKAMVEFIDTQTAHTKACVAVMNTVASQTNDQLLDFSRNMSKMDFGQFDLTKWNKPAK